MYLICVLCEHRLNPDVTLSSSSEGGWACLAFFPGVSDKTQFTMGSFVTLSSKARWPHVFVSMWICFSKLIIICCRWLTLILNCHGLNTNAVFFSLDFARTSGHFHIIDITNTTGCPQSLGRLLWTFRPQVLLKVDSLQCRPEDGPP